MYLVRKITFKQIVEVFIPMLLKALEQYKDNLFESDFVDLGHVFVPWVNWTSYLLRDQIFQFNCFRNFQADILCDKEAVFLNVFELMKFIRKKAVTHYYILMG